MAYFLGLILGILLCSQFHYLEKDVEELPSENLKKKINKTHKLQRRKQRV